MTTALDIIHQSLKICGAIGVGQTPLAEDANDALIAMNAMLAQWRHRRWLVYHLRQVDFIPDGSVSYTIGPGGYIDTIRPDRIEYAFFRLITQTGGNNVDYPLQVLQAREDYDRIALKTLSSFPAYLFCDTAFPLGNIFVWPVPNSTYHVHMSVKGELQSFPTLTTQYALPEEYEEAIKLNLAIRLSMTYQLPVSPQLATLVKVALNTVKNTNTQIPMLTMPSELTRGALYNIYSDSAY